MAAAQIPDSNFADRWLNQPVESVEVMVGAP